MQWKTFIFDNKVYDLSHLHPCVKTYVQAAKGNKPARLYKVDVIFSTHCFTRDIGNETPDLGLLYTYEGETRIFDFRRYELSPQLPAIIDRLCDCKCFHTERTNFFTVQAVDEQGNKVDYEVYFAVSKSSKSGVINLYIQSAYVRDPLYRPGRPKVIHWSQISFSVILYNTLHKIPIKSPK